MQRRFCICKAGHTHACYYYDLHVVISSSQDQQDVAESTRSISIGVPIGAHSWHKNMAPWRESRSVRPFELVKVALQKLHVTHSSSWNPKASANFRRCRWIELHLRLSHFAYAVSLSWATTAAKGILRPLFRGHCSLRRSPWIVAQIMAWESAPSLGCMCDSKGQHHRCSRPPPPPPP